MESRGIETISKSIVPHKLGQVQLTTKINKMNVTVEPGMDGDANG